MGRFIVSMKKILFHLRIIISQSSILVGGQAVIEGVMMRVPGAYATAVRDLNGHIQTNRHEFKSLTAVAYAPGTRIITPSITACPPTKIDD
jgi:uncharacterized protein YqhQ